MSQRGKRSTREENVRQLEEMNPPTRITLPARTIDLLQEHVAATAPPSPETQKKIFLFFFQN